ncbi:rhomboid family intramembrane serine protease [Litorimonas sp. RW-G-Af-16]|uniref:rhomboid family intramembrane serine protease n=1 Tax=Litorimonas sp. RW-G-Af-16 TaxID=3241168 RepID=UPI00390CB559
MTYENREPMFNFSEPTPVYWAAIMVVIEVLTIFAVGPLGNLLATYGIMRPFGTMPLGPQIISLLGHGFLHSGWAHVLMNSLFGIVFGIVTIRGAKVLATSRGKRSSGAGAFWLIFLLGVIGGGVAQWLVWKVMGTTSAAMVGASGGASALFAAAGWAMGGRAQMLQFGLGWAIVNVVLVVAAPILGTNVSWAGHMGGYAAGMVIAPLLVRANSTGFSVLR